MYLVMNDETGHYDIYAKVGDAVVLLDDTTVDLSAYAKTEVIQAWVMEQITALDVEQYATDEELQAVIVDVGAIQTALTNIYTKSEVDAKLAEKMDVSAMGAYATDD